MNKRFIVKQNRDVAGIISLNKFRESERQRLSYIIINDIRNIERNIEVCQTVIHGKAYDQDTKDEQVKIITQLQREVDELYSELKAL